MPRLWVMSDLHLDAVRHPEAFRPACPAFDVLVVAGDVWQGDTDRALRTVAGFADGKPAVFVLGNHEFWDREVAHERGVARRAAAKHGVTLLDDSEATLAGVRFVGGTLWADGILAGAEATPDRPTGERILVCQGRGGHTITGRDEARLHKRTRAVIEAAVGQAKGEPLTVPDTPAAPAAGTPPLVVVTHHAPHPLCLPPAHRTGWVAGNSASDLSHLTDGGCIALWVHGHVHHTVAFARPGGTRIVCNPAGPGFANPWFREDLVVTV